MAAEGALPDDVRAAFCDAAVEGIDCDHLSVRPREEGFTVAIRDGDGSEFERRVADEVELAAVADRHVPHVEEWHFWAEIAPQVAHRKAFLRWIEGVAQHGFEERRERLAAGIAREWGQLRIEATLRDGGRRTYEIRHVADADRPRAELTAHDDPRDARDVGRTDARGRYRPLPTAPTLDRGWVFGDLGPAAAVATVDAFYPATVANWHREREGDLDVSHWRETADRQTGIYDVVDELDGDELAWLTEACCVDSQCLKRREWDEDADSPIDVPRGDGEFPCREPCSLVIAAARTFALMEREDPEPVDLELTPTEQEGLRELLDAVAEGRVGEVREADVGDGANRYRARYLRAKLFGDGAPWDDGDSDD